MQRLIRDMTIQLRYDGAVAEPLSAALDVTDSILEQIFVWPTGLTVCV